MYRSMTKPIRMTSYFLYLNLAILTCFSCQENNEVSEVREATVQIERPEKPYSEFIKEIQEMGGSTANKQNRFFRFMNTDIPNYWTGTPWDFNGTSREPLQGNIACGYFVTNVLSDFGIELRRVYLAQQASSVMINELSASGSVKHFAKVKQVQDYLLSRGEQEIYIVGLDFHTGFVIRDRDRTYFLHSNYINRSGVIKEDLVSSSAFNASKSFMIGSLSENLSLF